MPWRGPSFFLKEADMTLYVIEMPDGYKDPDDVVRHDPELIKAILNSRKYGIDWLLEKGLKINSI